MSGRMLAAVLVALLSLSLLSLSLLTPPAAAADVTASRADALRWRQCDGSILRGAQCATLAVPLDWADPSGGTVRLAVARLMATGARRDRIGVLMFNPGGPGGSGTQSLRTVAAWLPDEVRQRFDLVSWDPRGVVTSGPLVDLCPMGQRTLPPATGPVDWAALGAAAYEDRAAAMGPCLATNAAAAPYLGTWSGVRDLDAIRRALGERQITLWGMSYGTTIGRAYAQQYPGRLRALILDGTIDPASTNASFAREQITAASTGWDRMAAWLGPRTRATYRRAMAALDERVITDDAGRTVTRWDIASSMLNSIPDQSTWSDARYLLRAVGIALFNPDADLRNRSAELLADAFESTDTTTIDPLLPLVDCTDLPGRLSSTEAADITAQAGAIGGILTGVAAMDATIRCAGIPADLGRPLPATSAITLPTPPIVINSIADPRTPWTGARAAANFFTGAVMISYDSAEHISWLRTESACINEAVTDYVLTTRLPAHDIACSFARSVPPPSLPSEPCPAA